MFSLYTFVICIIISLLDVVAEDDAGRTSAARRRTQSASSSYEVSPIDGSCHVSVSTRPTQNYNIKGKGLVFSIKSDDDDDDGLTVSSFKFHVDAEEIVNSGNVVYRVYALKNEGAFASPDYLVNPAGYLGDPSIFDSRGVTADWNVVAEGIITAEMLEQSGITLTNLEEDLYNMTVGELDRRYTVVPPNGGMRSFYIETIPDSLTYTDPDGDSVVNDPMFLMPVKPTEQPNPPKVLVGQLVMSWRPNDPFMYPDKSFAGKVYYERNCPSQAPSISSSPTEAPTIAKSASPSIAPTVSFAPTDSPSVSPTAAPSLSPSQVPIVSGGLLLTLKMECELGEKLPDDVKAVVADTVKKTAAEAGEALGVQKVKAEVTDVTCSVVEQRHLTANLANNKGGSRFLPTTSSALDFSVVITGEYRPPTRPGQRPEPANFDLGSIAEESINRDPVGFVKDLQERAAESSASAFEDITADDLAVESFEYNEGDPLVRATKQPTQKPTAPPILLMNSQSNKDDGNRKGSNSILVISIVIVSALIVLLGAFLLFRHGERRAAKKRRKEMARKELEKERKREERRQRAQWDDANAKRQAMNKDQFGSPAGYGHPPPPMDHPPPPIPPNYYNGSVPPVPPQNYSYPQYDASFPPPYGQPNYGAYPYPPPPPPAMQPGADYGQQPRETSVRWK